MKIKFFMQKNIKTCTESESVASTAKIMSTYNIGSVVVVKDDIPVGIFTERDLVQRVVAKDIEPEKITVGEVMTKNLITVGADKSLGSVYHIFVTKHIRHIPVVENGHLVGIVSQKDLAKVIDEQLFGMYYGNLDFSGDY